MDLERRAGATVRHHTGGPYVSQADIANKALAKLVYRAVLLQAIAWRKRAGTDAAFEDAQVPLSDAGPLGRLSTTVPAAAGSASPFA